MKVSELIQQLQQLDQDKNIWAIYDSFDLFKIEFEVEDGMYDHLYKDGLKKGDYILVCG